MVTCTSEKLGPLERKEMALKANRINHRGQCGSKDMKYIQKEPAHKYKEKPAFHNAGRSLILTLITKPCSFA